jgi:glycosyltransferase involved in cell wall biosynthesis
VESRKVQAPTVSFVVPCYKLAHLLPECIHSILNQTYGDFEVLIMDDASPDDTAVVARSFGDPRVKLVRNEPNLGHLRNYNKGIGLSQGKYIWLISADDYLRKPYVLERYVQVMEQHPNAGYAICAGYGVRDGVETRLLGCYSERRNRDRLFRGHQLLKRLLQSNFVLTPSGMVRRDCYEKSLFDLALPFCGDWYLWCLFAMDWDVAYFAEPMVCYREHHDFALTTEFMNTQVDSCAAQELAVPWLIRKRARDAGDRKLEAYSLSGIARMHGHVMASQRYRKSSFFMNFDRFEDALREHEVNDVDRQRLTAMMLMSIGNECYWQEDFTLARQFYGAALRTRPWMVTARAKRLLLALGKPGQYVRKTILAYRW